MNQNEYIKQLETTIESLEKQISNLSETVAYLTKKIYGSSSEKTKDNDINGQLNLFDEAENEAVLDAPEPDLLAITLGALKKKKPKTTREELLKSIPISEIICELTDEDRICPYCNTEMIPIGKETVREELQFIPAKLKLIRYIRYAYECPECRKTGTPYIDKAVTPEPLMKHSLASPSTVAYVMYQKYVNGMPLYRQEKDWEQYGVKLSRATLANWVIYCSRNYMMPLVELMKEELLKREILHADETTLQVLKEDGKTATSKSYMWLYRTGNDGESPVVLYDYQPSRGGYHASEYLEGFHGYLHTDGYQGYGKVKDLTRCGCWAHLRRYFVDAIPEKKGPDKAKIPAEIGRDYCDKLFHLEKEYVELSPEERRTKRLEQEKPVLDAFWCWLESLEALKGSRLGKAVTYAKNQKPLMENYLLDGRCSISNNLAENSIRPFTVGRKNWLFSDTAKGAQSSAVIYSLVETAKANGLNIYKYLQQVLLNVPGYQNEPDDIKDFLPWSDMMQQMCKL